MKILALWLIAVAGCTSQQAAQELATGGGGQLPCDVAQILSTHCNDCHRDPPVWGALMPLTTFGELVHPSTTDPSKSYAQVALARITDANNPMPPFGTSALLTQSEIATFQQWVTDGTPSGECDAPSNGKNPYGVPSVCTSGRMWTLGTRGSAQMEPGQACIACHDQSFGAPTLLIGGTAFQSAHEPDDCDGQSTGSGGSSQVIVTDSAKNVFMLSVSASSGNFYLEDNGQDFIPPITAKIVSGTRERAMQAAQTTGDCNSCHTQAGDMNAPGRILLP